MILQRGLERCDRPLLAALLDSLSVFTADERAVAMELVDARLGHPDSDDYRFILSFDGPRLAGYLCYGRTPMTQSTYDLYWVATSPEFARSGVARGLIESMEGEIAREGGGIIRVETGSREGHGAAVHFYDATAFSRAATIVDFYAPGDDLIIFIKRVRSAAAPSLVAMDEPALYDAAFGYRDYAAVRDFLLGCAKRFGDRDVRRVLGWACGPARQIWAFADVGISAIGAEASDAMIAYAQRSGGPRPTGSPEVRFVKAGLDDRPDVASPVDLSFVPLSSIHLLGSMDALADHLKVAAELLAPGGLHIIEATHPADLTASGVHHTEWTEVRGEYVVDARFRMHIGKVEPLEHGGLRVPVTLDVVCSSSNKKGGGPQRVQQRLRQEDRWFIPDLGGWRGVIAKVPELELVAALGDFNVDVPFEHTAAWRLILVLKRR